VAGTPPDGTRASVRGVRPRSSSRLGRETTGRLHRQWLQSSFESDVNATPDTLLCPVGTIIRLAKEPSGSNRQIPAAASWLPVASSLPSALKATLRIAPLRLRGRRIPCPYLRACAGCRQHLAIGTEGKT